LYNLSFIVDGRELAEQESHHVRADMARRVRADGKYTHTWVRTWSSLATNAIGIAVINWHVATAGCGI
jgi:hypothetical protein